MLTAQNWETGPS